MSELINQLVEEESVESNPLMAEQRHVLVVTFPAQGHINPALQFAKRLTRMGVEVTFLCSVFAHRRISKSLEGNQHAEGLKIVSFSDGFDDGYKRSSSSSDSANVDVKKYISEMKTRGARALKEIILAAAAGGENEHPISRVVYTLLLPWVAEVARECHVPSAMLWIQPATLLDIYYFYFNGYQEEITKNCNDPNWSIQLPGKLPLFSIKELPSFFVPSIYNVILDMFKEQLDSLEQETEPKILVNTFDALEPDALKAIERYNLIAVGPLMPSAFLDGKDPSDTSFGGDLFEKSKDYIQWLNSKPQSSVVYISFGSILDLPRTQMEEIAKGLLETARQFLWVVKKKEEVEDKTEEEDEKLSNFMEDLEKQGMIVPWCSQLEVLTHPALGCFVSHCGWNSSLESIACGVPVVAFPQWTDQKTNAKLLEEVWETGVRVRARDDGIVESDEIRRCIDIVMDGGGKGGELRANAQRWKGLARIALKDGGTSDKNLKSFIEEVGITSSNGVTKI